MTTEERFERLEHYTVGLAEERRKDREEYKALWRDTQRQLNEVSVRLLQLSEDTAALAVQGRETERRLRELGEATDARIKTLGEATDARIAALVSAIGQHVRQGHPQQ
jgi:hypothetical protein